VSALDVSVRAQVLNLLRELQEELGHTYLFISHDMSVVESICDRVAVMYLGKIVEVAETDAIYRNPQHPYTEALLSAVPRPDPKLRDSGRRIRLSDDFPDPANPPSGCFFHTRCVYADGAKCTSDGPILREIDSGHAAACHYSEDLELAGVLNDADQAATGQGRNGADQDSTMRSSTTTKQK
jgi:oligopeptide/dipeptide ABC transporter ATP-binding protein